MNYDKSLLTQIEANIYNMLQDICDKKRKIMLEEMKMYSDYLKNYFQESLDKNGKTYTITKIVFWTIHLANPNIGYNIVAKEQPKENIEFFKNEFQKNKVLEKYEGIIDKILSKLSTEDLITREEFEQYDEIFYEHSFITPQDDKDSIKIMKLFQKKSKELQVSSKTLENRIERYIQEGLKNKEYFSKTKDFIDIIIKYFETQLNGTAIEINQNSTISHLIRVAQKGKLPQDISTLILGKLQERLKNTSIPKIDNVEDLENYMQKVAEIRLQQGRMPRECSDYILKQSILKQASEQNEEMSKYNGMIERALEDFTEYELEDSKLNDYYVAVLNQHYLKEGNAGSINQECQAIDLSRNFLLTLGTLELIDSSLHECTHAEQYDKIKTGKLNGSTYKMLKELILRIENRQFVYSNYRYMYEEIDARKNAYMKRIKVLRRMGLKDIIIYILGAREVKQTIKDYNQDYKLAKMKRVGQDVKDINVIFLELLQEKPELLEKYPELNIEFERKGDIVQTKSLANVLRAYEQSITQASSQEEIQRISSLFSEILLNSGEITEERIQTELQDLIEFKSDNKIIKAYKEKILISRFPRQMVLAATMKNFYKNSSTQDRQHAHQELKNCLDESNKTIKQEEIEIE